MDGRGAGTLTSQRRTSTQTVLGTWSHPSAVSAAVERRAHRICRLPAENREPPVEERYEPELDMIKRFRAAGKPLPMVQSSTYSPDIEPTLRTGVTATTAAALNLFRHE